MTESRTLILKLNATGDVVRTTPLLRCLSGRVSWITADKNIPLLSGVSRRVKCCSWTDRSAVLADKFDLVINLEDDRDVAEFVKKLNYKRIFGAFLDKDGVIRYTKDSAGWFDLSLISAYGRRRADELKLRNRRTYQELLFEGLGFDFQGEEYLLPTVDRSALSGDIAIAPVAGAVWPMKNWAFYDDLTSRLLEAELTVNVLPTRETLLEHLADVASHRCLVSGDSLPMHLALGSGIACVTLFMCTSPWEIYDYGLMTKLISPSLSEFFYQRGMDERATSAISVDEVFNAVIKRLEAIPAP